MAYCLIGGLVKLAKEPFVGVLVWYTLPTENLA
jgi:hypothetical protein